MLNIRRLFHGSTLLVMMLFGLSACVLGTVVGVVADTAIEVAKVPFKVGGAVIDAVSDDEDEEIEEDNDE